MIALWLLAGCPTPPPCLEDPPAIEIGTGEDAWQPLPETLDVVRGPQGGWHVLGSARVANTTRQVAVDFTVEVEEALVAEGHYEVVLRPVDACTGEYAGMYAFLDVPGGEVDGARALLVMEATDAEGRWAHAQAPVILWSPD